MNVGKLIDNQQVVTIRIDANLGDAASLMRSSHVSGIPVVDEWGVLCGLITASTLIEVIRGDAQPDAGPQAPHARAVKKHWETMPVRDVMVTKLCAVNEDETVAGAAKAMVQHHVHRAVVIGKDRNVRGVLSALDIVRLVAEGGMELR